MAIILQLVLIVATIAVGWQSEPAVNIRPTNLGLTWTRTKHTFMIYLKLCQKIRLYANFVVTSNETY